MHFNALSISTVQTLYWRWHSKIRLSFLQTSATVPVSTCNDQIDLIALEIKCNNYWLILKSSCMSCLLPVFQPGFLPLPEYSNELSLKYNYRLLVYKMSESYLVTVKAIITMQYTASCIHYCNHNCNNSNITIGKNSCTCKHNNKLQPQVMPTACVCIAPMVNFNWAHCKSCALN